MSVQVAWPKFHRPQFARSRFAITVLNLLLVYTALAWVFVLTPEEPTLLAEIPLTDAMVVERTDEQIVVRVSHPTQQQMCSIDRDDFTGDLPEVGGVVSVDYNGTTCLLPPWTDTRPSLAMRISAILGTVILAGWTFRAVTRPQTSGPQSGGPQSGDRRKSAEDRSRAKSRRRRKRRLKR